VSTVSKSVSCNFLESSEPVSRPVEGLIKLTLNTLWRRLTFLEIEVDKFKDFYLSLTIFRLKFNEYVYVRSRSKEVYVRTYVCVAYLDITYQRISVTVEIIKFFGENLISVPIVSS